jgi:anti-sigma factor RsiW
MSGPGDRTEELEFWRRWRVTSAEAPPVDAMLLAAYAEGRLDESAAEPVEAWLADHPEAFADIAAARAAASAADDAVPEPRIGRALALVAPLASGAEIVPFPAALAARRRTWRDAAAWGAVAASLLVTSMFGFEIGSSAYANLTTQPSVAAESVAHELIDPPSGLFSEDDDSAT